MTTKIIDLPGRSVEFTVLRDNYAYAKTVIDGEVITLNIDIASDQIIDWKDVADFIKKFDYPRTLHDYVFDAKILAIDVARAFFKGGVEHYEMQFLNSIYYKGIEKYENGRSRGPYWQLSFVYCTPDRSDGDVYGDYIVEFIDSQIVGGRRNWI